MKKQTHLSPARLQRSRFNPIRSLTPQSLGRMLDAFQGGELRAAALLWDAIERRDDLLQGLVSKRKKSVARLDWEVLTIEDTPEAHAHREVLVDFYNNVTTTHACDTHQQGGLSLLIKQMMDAVGKKYAVHELSFEDMEDGTLTGTFRFVPLWFFENRTGSLRFLRNDHDPEGIALEEGQWMVTTGDGLMESSSIAFLFKHLPLRDWLVYCERNGMPGVRGVTDAHPGTPEWEAARQAVADFGAEFHALMTRGTEIEAIDITAKGELPYPRLVERMDRALAALWRGADLSTLSRGDAHGASLQREETLRLEADDAAWISETLNAQVDRLVLNHRFGVSRGKAYFKLKLPAREERREELAFYKELKDLGVHVPRETLCEALGIQLPESNQETHPTAEPQSEKEKSE